MIKKNILKTVLGLLITGILATAMLPAGCSGSNGKDGTAGPAGPTGGTGPTGIEPLITNITPMASVNTIVTITGQNFSSTQGSSKVWMNGVDAGPAISWTDTQITIKPPASLVSSDGITQTVIANVAVNQLASNAVAYDLVPSGTVQPVHIMIAPRAITSTPSNMLYATDGLGNIAQIDQNGVAQVIATGLSSPQGIVFTNNALYVAETTADSSGMYWIKVVSTSSKVTPWKSRTVQPYGIANDDAGNLYITYPGDGSVYKYAINGSGSEPTNLSSGSLTNPEGIAYVNGYLYIAANNNIAQYNITSHALNTTWATGICAPGNTPIGVVYWTSQNVLLVSCPGNNTISKVTMTGAVSQGFITSNGNHPLGMTFDANGNLYIANSNDVVVTKVTFTGAGAPNTISWFAAGPYPYIYSKNAQDSVGNAYLPVYTHTLVVKLTPDNKTSIYASNDTIITSLFAGCTFSSNGMLLMSDAVNKKVDIVPAGGGTITTWIDTTALGSPYDVAVDGSGSVFVNMNTTSVAKYDPSGTQINASFVSGLVGFASLFAQSSSLIIPDANAQKLYTASSSGSGPVAPTSLANIILYSVSPAPSGQFYGIDGTNIFLIDPANGGISFVSAVPSGNQISTMPDGSLLTSYIYLINRVYP